MLNEQQKKAVEHINWPILILAWAGAGKTHTLTSRVANMISNHNILPESILCVTFTNKAAREMRERIAKNLWKNLENYNFYRSHNFPLIWTFHSIWVFFLRQFIDKLWYDKNFSIIDEEDKIKTIKEILEEKWYDTKETQPRWVAYAISTAKNNWFNAKIYAQNIKSYFEEKVSEVYLIYEKRLQEMNLLDFDDILIKTYDILKIPEVLDFFQNKYKYFLVDEYQDTNEIQYNLVNLLASKTKNICVVGDDWQWIYSWRWANIKNIHHFQRDYKNCELIKLEQNYRSTQTIINSANCVIKCNPWIMEKTLWTSNIEWDKIEIIETTDEKHEAQEIVKKINKIIEDPASNVAILYRTNWQSRLIEESLINSWIPYRVYGGVKFYERKEIKDILAYLKLISNPFDLLSFKRIINLPARKIWPKSVNTILQYSRNYNISLLDVLSNAAEIPELTPLARKWVETFYNLYIHLLDNVDKMSLQDLLWEVVRSLEYEEYLVEEYWKEDAEWRMENLSEFKNMASAYNWIATREALSMFLEEIALITDADQNQNTNFQVSLMTIHLSKWLEFDNVFIVWAEEWIFPHSRSLQEAKELEEERRLMYVAITRAKKNLFISYARERFYFWSFTANPKSRFIKEIPSEYTNFEQVLRNDFTFSSFNFIKKPSNFTFTSEDIASSKIKKVENNVGEFKLWDKVDHVKFGVWTLISIDWEYGNIAFGWWNGIKKMSLKLAPIKKL